MKGSIVGLELNPSGSKMKCILSLEELHGRIVRAMSASPVMSRVCGTSETCSHEPISGTQELSAG